MRRISGFAALALLAAGDAEAQIGCDSRDFVPQLEAFRHPGTGRAVVGKAIVLALAEDNAAAATSGRAPKPGRFAGQTTIRIAKAGRYQVGLSQKAWIAMRIGGRDLESVKHQHGPSCSGIAKLVSFDLTPGTYSLAVSEAEQPTATLLVVPDY